MQATCIAPHGACPIDGTVRGKEQALKVHELHGKMIKKNGTVDVTETARKEPVRDLSGNLVRMDLVKLGSGFWYPLGAFRLP